LLLLLRRLLLLLLLLMLSKFPAVKHAPASTELFRTVAAPATGTAGTARAAATLLAAWNNGG
jgi:hypothetical protein